MLRICFLLCAFLVPIFSQETDTPSLKVKADAGTIIWVDNLRYGTVQETGELAIRNLKVGTHKLRARLLGKSEVIQSFQLKANTPATIQITFKLPPSAAEESFQNAEALREKGKHKEAIAEYQAALNHSKTLFTQARIGLARSLMASGEYEQAITEARRAAKEAATNSTLAAEATTVVANTFRAQGLYEEAFENYRKALSLTRNISPEAHTGVALTYQEENKLEEAIRHFQSAVEQANETEPIIYYLLGNLLDREGKIKEAIATYETYLRLAPNSKFAVTTRSMLRQLKRDAR